MFSSPVPVIIILAPSTGEWSEVSLPNKLTGKVPVWAPTCPLVGDEPNDKIVGLAESLVG